MRTGLRLASRPYAPPAGPVLIVAPHPDDETLGCGGLIARQARAGRRVEVLFLTDGAASHPGHPVLFPAELARRRRAESLAALGTLGLSPERARFWDLPDGALDRLPPSAAEDAGQRLSAWLAELRPEAIFAPFRGDGSTEHAAALDLVAAARARAGVGALLEYPVWAWWNPLRLRGRLRRRAGNFRLFLGADRELKLSALRCHRTQAEASPPWPEAVLPRILADGCCGPEEFFFASGAAGPQCSDD